MNSKEENDGEEFSNDYEESMEYDFIYPEFIPKDKMKESFNNLFKGKPQKKNMEGKFQDKKQVLKENNKMKSYTSPEEAKSNDNFTSDEKFSDNQSNENLQNIKFGQHAVYSLFEYYARDIIHQLFNYHPMYYYNFKFTSKNEKEDNKIEDSSIKEDKKFETSRTKEDMKSKDNGKLNMKIKGDNDKKDKKTEASNHEEEEKKEVIDISNSNNENSNPKNKNDEKSNIYINIINNKASESNAFDNIKKNITPVDIENKNDKIPKMKKEKKKNKELLYHGDFDFVIPNITFEEISKVLSNKRISPFIFHGNIKENMKFDIIGEIKENIGESRRNYEQIKKYISLINLLRVDENANEAVGLNLRNEKLVLYVFNTGYQRFLFKMIEYKKHYKQFEMIDEKFKNEHYKNIINIPRKFKDEAKDETRLDIVNMLINSSIPYIFIFIPSITSFITMIKKRKSMIDQLNSIIIVFELFL